MADFRDLIISLERMGILDVILPFILIFTLVFAVLEKTNILGDGKKNFNVAVAFVMSMAVVIPHVTNSYPRGTDIVVIINTFLPQVALLSVVIIMILITLGMFGAHTKILGEGGWKNGFTIGSVVILLGLMLANLGLFNRYSIPRWLYFIFDSQFVTLIIALIVFGLIIRFITGDGLSDGERDARKKAADKKKAQDALAAAQTEAAKYDG